MHRVYTTCTDHCQLNSAPIAYIFVQRWCEYRSSKQNIGVVTNYSITNHSFRMFIWKKLLAMFQSLVYPTNILLYTYFFQHTEPSSCIWLHVIWLVPDSEYYSAAFSGIRNNWSESGFVKFCYSSCYSNMKRAYYDMGGWWWYPSLSRFMRASCWYIIQMNKDLEKRK